LIPCCPHALKFVLILLVLILTIVGENEKPMSTRQWRQGEKNDDRKKVTHNILLVIKASRARSCFQARVSTKKAAKLNRPSSPIGLVIDD
jgi:hypothetical protein